MNRRPNGWLSAKSFGVVYSELSFDALVSLYSCAPSRRAFAGVSIYYFHHARLPRNADSPAGILLSSADYARLRLDREQRRKCAGTLFGRYYHLRAGGPGAPRAHRAGPARLAGGQLLPGCHRAPQVLFAIAFDRVALQSDGT